MRTSRRVISGCVILVLAREVILLRFSRYLVVRRRNGELATASRHR